MRLLVLLVALLCACSRHERTLDGAGASLPYPLYSKWATEYTGARVNYQPLGSGAGVRQVSDGVVDFGATDEPMSDAQLKEAHADLVHVPMTVGAVVIAFNVAGVKQLKLGPDVIADIFRGTIAKWSDPRVAEQNAGVTLPDAPIAVVHRADGSGTSAALTSYLAWGKTPAFAGIGVRGNDGVAGYVKNTPNAIGYLELAYARQSGLAFAQVRNRAGKWMQPNVSALDHAARTALTHLPDDLRVSIVDADDADAYPIASLSFLVLPRDAKDRTKGEALSQFVWWALHDGQRFAADLDYAPLPPELVARAEVVVKSLRAEGKPL
jgi:phosphate transport system substrate-binding protein